MEDKNRSVINNVKWKLVERVASVLISFSTTIVLARLLSPENYGLVALINILVTMLTVFVTNGVGNSLIQKEEADDLDFSTMFWCNIAFSVSIYVVLFVLAPYVSKFYGYNELKSMLRVLALHIIIAAVNSIQIASISRRMLFRNYFFSTLWGRIFSGVVGICLAYCGAGAWALVTQDILLVGVETIVLWHRGGWRPQFKFNIHRAKNLYSFAWKVMLSSFIVQLNDQIRSLVIGKRYTSEDLAFYDKGMILPNTLVTNIMTALSSVMFPALSKEQSSLERVREMMRKWISLSAYIMVPMVMGLAVIASNVIVLLFSEKWISSTFFIQVACVVYGTRIIELPIRESLKAIGRAEIFLRMQIVKTLISIVSLLCVMNLGMKMIAITAAICSLINAAISMFYANKLLNYSYFMLVKDIGSTLILSLIMCFGVYILNGIGAMPLIMVIVQAAAGMAIYFVASIATNNQNMRYCIRLIKEKIGVHRK